MCIYYIYLYNVYIYIYTYIMYIYICIYIYIYLLIIKRTDLLINDNMYLQLELTQLLETGRWLILTHGHSSRSLFRI